MLKVSEKHCIIWTMGHEHVHTLNKDYQAVIQDSVWM